VIPDKSVAAGKVLAESGDFSNLYSDHQIGIGYFFWLSCHSMGGLAML
jgi:hypothetical protein